MLFAQQIPFGIELAEPGVFQIQGVDERHNHVHLAGGFLFVDIFVQIRVLCAPGVLEIDLQQPVFVVLKMPV